MWWLLVIPGALAAYLMFLRPALKAIPAFKQFYVEADTFWAKLKALAGNSLTIAWSYFMAAIGFFTQWIDALGGIVGDPDLKAQITNSLQANPEVLGYVLMGISAITIVARLRSISNTISNKGQ